MRTLSVPSLVAALLVGCVGTVENPTGDCRADHDGSRACTHALVWGEVYLPHCQAPLDREYWRVLGRSDRPAYVFPRPDAAGLTYGICDGDDADLADLFDRNGLCDETADPSVVNAMTAADALAVTHALHERLDFEAVDVGDGIWAIDPPAFPDDLAAACEGPAADVQALDGACEVYLTRAQGDEMCPDIAYVLSADEAAALADALDALYGIGA